MTEQEILDYVHSSEQVIEMQRRRIDTLDKKIQLQKEIRASIAIYIEEIIKKLESPDEKDRQLGLNHLKGLARTKD